MCKWVILRRAYYYSPILVYRMMWYVLRTMEAYLVYNCVCANCEAGVDVTLYIVFNAHAITYMYKYVVLQWTGAIPSRTLSVARSLACNLSYVQHSKRDWYQRIQEDILHKILYLLSIKVCSICQQPH